MMINNTIRNINGNLEKMNTLNQQMSTGKKIQSVSDDPVCASRALKYRTYVSQIEQYQDNTADAQSWLEITEQALSDLNDVMQQVRELTVEASNGTLSSDELDAIKTEIEQLKDSVIELGNQTYAGRYIFAGYETDSAPFEIEETSVGEKIKYNGSYLSLDGVVSSDVDSADYITYYNNNAGDIFVDTDQEIVYNIGRGSQIQVNVEGNEVFGTGVEGIFETFQKLEIALDGGSEYKTIEIDPSNTATVVTESLEIDDILDDIDTDISRILKVTADVGARTSYLELVQERLDTDYITYTELMSKNEDVDSAEVAIEFASSENIYNASLSAGSKVIVSSLVDYIT